MNESRKVKFRIESFIVFVVSATRSLHYARPITRQLFNPTFLDNR